MNMLQPVICTLIILLNAPTSEQYNIAAGRNSDEFYCANFGIDHVMCRFLDINRACVPFNFFPRQYLHELVGENIFQKYRNDYANTDRVNNDPNLKPSDYKIPNMNGLIWDEELTALAERYVFQCPSQIYPYNDVADFKVAQILTAGVHPGKFEDITSLTAKLLLDPEAEIHQFHIVGKENGKTELLCNYNEANSLSVISNPYFKYYGCAFANMRQAFDIPNYRYFKVLLVCNFGPLTNDSFTKIQPRGKPCSKCPKGMKCLRKSATPYLCFDSDEPDDPTTAEVSDEITSIIEQQVNVTEPFPSTEETEPQPEISTVITREPANFSDHCFITCSNGVPHCLCVYNNSSDDYEEVVLISGREVRESILFWHNNIRNIVAGGIQGYPMAGNMREFQWNSRLETSAVLWASQCQPHKYGCQDEYLTDGSDFPTRVTQLVAPFIWDEDGGLPPYTQSLQNWLLGVKFFHRDMLQRYVTPEKEADYSSFVQLIWAKSYMVGCGVALCHHKLEDSNQNDTDLDYIEDLDEGESLVITVCNYAPGGLIDGKSVYLVGGPCSLCTRLHNNNTGGIYCSREYISLCSGATSVLPAICKWIGIVLISLFL